MVKIFKLLCMVMCMMTKFQGLRSEEIITTTKITYCYNLSLKGFRLSAPIVEVRNVSWRSACVDVCFAHPCCRSMNYKHATSANQSDECELLHDRVDNTSYALETNSSFDHFFFNEPLKEYNASCIPEEPEEQDDQTRINIIDICSSAPCLNNGSCFVNGSTGYRCTCLDGYSGTRCERTYNSCEAILDKNSSASDGIYYLKSKENSEMYPVYCHMSSLSTKCGGGGWTLVMKLDRNKTTFQYSSPFWTNKVTWNVKAGLDGLAQNETKLASYHNTPFTKVCLGMTRNGVTNWILVHYTATSLYSVITGENSHDTNAGRGEWLSLINGTKLQPHCNKEGFNVNFSNNNPKLRIGITGNNENDCGSCDSLIGFGIETTTYGTVKWSSGNIYLYPDISLIKTFGYIFVQ